MLEATPQPPARGPLCKALYQLLGLWVQPAELTLEWRTWRWVALLPPYTALIADSAAGWQRLALEAELIGAARRAAGDVVPAVLAQSPDLWLQVREHKVGLSGAQLEARIFGLDAGASTALSRYAPSCPLTRWGEVFAAELGAVLARLHQGMSSERIMSRLGALSVDWEKIESVVKARSGSALLIRACPRVRAWDIARASTDGHAAARTALHGDPHLHNVFALEDGRLSGIIDLDEAAVGDLHEDLRYLHSQGPRFAELAMSAYADEAAVDVDRDRVARLHVRCAFEHFSWVQPDSPRFPKIVAWAAEALQALAPRWGA